MKMCEFCTKNGKKHFSSLYGEMSNTFVIVTYSSKIKYCRKVAEIEHQVHVLVTQWETGF